MLPKAVCWLLDAGVEEESRNGPVLQSHEPVILEYWKPQERVMFHAERDCNPFFHLFEFMWMIAGRQDLAPLQFFNSGMANYSDDGATLNGAYGYRWRKHFMRDQLNLVIEGLKNNPKCRRQLLSMWDARHDLSLNSKDLPCNIAVTFDASSGKLNMTVFNRSNDLVWGALGADCVHFSLLHEYVGRCIGMDLGSYFQVSSNFHAYLSNIDKVSHLPRVSDPYERGRVAIRYPLVVNKDRFDSEAAMITELNTSVIGYQEPFMRRVMMPMIDAYKAFKSGSPDRFQAAKRYLGTMDQNMDWTVACREWIERREAKANGHTN